MQALAEAHMMQGWNPDAVKSPGATASCH
jgi:hypothetical protein